MGRKDNFEMGSTEIGLDPCSFGIATLADDEIWLSG